MASSRCLHDNANYSDNRSSNERGFSSPSIGTGRGYEGSEEASGLEGRNDIRGEICLTDFVKALKSIRAVLRRVKIR